MFRGPQILTRSCPVRPLLLGVRDSHSPALFEHPCARRRGDRALKERKHEGISGRKEGFSFSIRTASSSTALSISSLDYDNYLRAASTLNHTPKALLSNHHLPPQVSGSKPKLASDPWKSTILEDLAQNPRALQTNHDCSMSTMCLKSWKRPWDMSQPLLSVTTKTPCNLLQSCSFHRQHFLRPWILNNFLCRLPPCSLSSPHSRAVHSAAPRETTVLRDCLSLENEERCRQCLRPNLKLYEVDKVRSGAGQTQGKGQGRWASILVSLCSVEGEPAFLFTLRSSMLKGRHKGDVSFAGGKSDPSDRDVVATALREAREELGINVAAENVWGVLRPLRDMSGMLIAPVLANLGPIEALSFKPNPGEVEEIFTLSLSHLCNPQNCGYTHFRTGDKYGYTAPVFRNGKHRVWGLTAVALQHTLKLIVPP
ncbi:mitochondrial coenzyme A diphosphatase NUDT8 [Myripristis murdjan]|uniref:Nudix hydrolase 8 n=1 Tax=Myripristis murdjan TaxID=586833 RepID=A0A667Y912_9TELE|nr:nucleoside diphosphate-linked moiety X motif 8 [Myripristis murdjan]